MVQRWLYRTRQFFEMIFSHPTPEDLALARQILTPTQLALFSRLQLSEQAHAVRVLQKVEVVCHSNGIALPDDLRVAALLHDVGKVRYPLRLWERVMVVLGKAIAPERVKNWENHPPRGWVRPFVVAAHHPNWGADLVAERGASPRVVALIRRHQDHLPKNDFNNDEDRLLAILQAVDDES